MKYLQRGNYKMCAIYGFLDYGKKIPHRVLSKLLKEISIAAECRGTDATGISYVNDGQVITYNRYPSSISPLPSSAL